MMNAIIIGVIASVIATLLIRFGVRCWEWYKKKEDQKSPSDTFNHFE